MRSTRIIKAAKLGYMALSALFCLVGIAMISRPGFSADVVARLVGVMLIVFGIVRIIGFYSKDLYRLAFQHDLALGILTAALGLLIVLKPGWALNIVCLTLGIEIITDGLFKIQTALDARRFGLHTWWLINSDGAGRQALRPPHLVADTGPRRAHGPGRDMDGGRARPERQDAGSAAERVADRRGHTEPLRGAVRHQDHCASAAR